MSFCVFLLDLLTGAVGLPLPTVEVRIVMNNKTNITVVEGNHRETQVLNEQIRYELIYLQTVDEKRSYANK